MKDDNETKFAYLVIQKSANRPLFNDYIKHIITNDASAPQPSYVDNKQEKYHFLIEHMNLLLPYLLNILDASSIGFRYSTIHPKENSLSGGKLTKR